MNKYAAAYLLTLYKQAAGETTSGTPRLGAALKKSSNPGARTGSYATSNSSGSAGKKRPPTPRKAQSTTPTPVQNRTAAQPSSAAFRPRTKATPSPIQQSMQKDIANTPAPPMLSRFHQPQQQQVSPVRQAIDKRVQQGQQLVSGARQLGSDMRDSLAYDVDKVKGHAGNAARAAGNAVNRGVAGVINNPAKLIPGYGIANQASKMMGRGKAAPKQAPAASKSRINNTPAPAGYMPPKPNQAPFGINNFTY